MANDSSNRLVRSIGRWSLVALILNTMIGASIFGLPALIAARLGKWSPVGFLVALAGIATIAACMAEVASQFRETGGPYLYTRVAFGRFVAIENGWLTWLSRIAAVSAVANLFVAYLSEFLPAVRQPLVRATVLVVLIGILALVNYRGVAGGRLVSNFFTVTKIALLLFFVLTGLSALLLDPTLRVNPPALDPRASDWFEAVLLMIYSYGGFEAALIASGETLDTRKDIPFALFASIGAATLLFVGVQYLVVHTVQNVATSIKPAVDSARHFLPPLGVRLVAAGTLISAYGYLSANLLHTPRITFAMSRGGDFPAFLGKIHPKFRTPHISILVFALLVTLFSIGGDFRWNAMLSSVARLFVYGSVAASLPVLRKKQPQADRFRLPAGGLFSALALLFTGVLLTRIQPGELLVIAATTLLALLNWQWARTRPEPVGNLATQSERGDPL